MRSKIGSLAISGMTPSLRDDLEARVDAQGLHLLVPALGAAVPVVLAGADQNRVGCVGLEAGGAMDLEGDLAAFGARDLDGFRVSGEGKGQGENQDQR